jgi:hypothetical protein
MTLQPGFSSGGSICRACDATAVRLREIEAALDEASNLIPRGPQRGEYRRLLEQLFPKASA